MSANCLVVMEKRTDTELHWSQQGEERQAKKEKKQAAREMRQTKEQQKQEEPESQGGKNNLNENCNFLC